jgi:predicted O-methyltransferase YrrM
MTTVTQEQIENTLENLFSKSKNDHLKMIRGVAKSVFRPIMPADFKDVFLSISKEQGIDLKQLITNNGIKNILEFGTSFGISTLFLAQGALETGGTIITTELIESKANTAIENFKKAGVSDIIEVRMGDAMNTLKNHNTPIDLLFLDGWKNLYLPLFRMLEHNFHSNTIIYVDNADMRETQFFLNTVKKNQNYKFESLYSNKAILIRSLA